MKKDWYMLISNDYHHPSLGWIKKLNVEVYYGKRKKYCTHQTCSLLNIQYLRTLNLNWRDSSRLIPESLDELWKRETPFVSI